MKKTILIVLVALIIGACSSSNEPKDSEYYVYHSTPFEVIKVYGEGGAEIPKSQWDAEIMELYKEYQEKVDFQKLSKYYFDGDNLMLVLDNTPYNLNHIKRGDTVYFSFSGNPDIINDLDIPIALIIDSNTLEFHFNIFLHRGIFGTTGFNSSKLGGYEEFFNIIGKSVDEIAENEILAIFAGKFQYKK